MADTIKNGSFEVSSFKVGSSDCKIYLGDTLLYPHSTPPFQGKWLATYSDLHTESAECGSSSAITRNEINKTNLVSVEIGDCVTSIDSSAFSSCSSLTSCTIGSGITSIGKAAFDGCNSLTSITVEATTPPALPSIALRQTNNCIIYVPSGSVDAYKAASGWSSYASRIQAIPNS